MERVTRIELALSAREAAGRAHSRWDVSARQRHELAAGHAHRGLGVPYPCHNCAASVSGGCRFWWIIQRRGGGPPTVRGKSDDLMEEVHRGANP